MTTTSCNDGKNGKSAGTILRETREALGLSLDDAARVTRIVKGHLIALEEGTYDRLPSAVYAKGFLRVYAGYLKLPVNDILSAYENELAGNDPCSENREVAMAANDKIPKRTSRRMKWLFLISGVLAVAVLSSRFLLTSPVRFDGNKKQSFPTRPAPKPPVAVIPPAGPGNAAAGAQDREQPDKVQEAKNAEVSDIHAPSSPKGMVLKVKATEDGWLDVTIDDVITQHYELKSGDLIEWKGEKSFSLDIGNAGGIEAELDGKTLKRFGKNGEFAHVLLKPGGITE